MPQQILMAVLNNKWDEPTHNFSFLQNQIGDKHLIAASDISQWEKGRGGGSMNVIWCNTTCQIAWENLISL